MILRFDLDGSATSVYGEDIDLFELGRVEISRASHVEPNADGTWTADLEPVGGPVIGSFTKRSDAIAAEVAWLERWLVKGEKT